MEIPPEPSSLERLIGVARRRVRMSHAEYSPDFDDLFRHVDSVLGNSAVSPLEKAMYLLLNQFVGDQQDYFVVPRERVRVPELYELTSPGYKDYEIDFAVYSGSPSRFVKIAVECDGIRSHRERHADRDRHKDVNLQVPGGRSFGLAAARFTMNLRTSLPTTRTLIGSSPSSRTW